VKLQVFPRIKKGEKARRGRAERGKENGANPSPALLFSPPLLSISVTGPSACFGVGHLYFPLRSALTFGSRLRRSRREAGSLRPRRVAFVVHRPVFPRHARRHQVAVRDRPHDEGNSDGAVACRLGEAELGHLPVRGDRCVVGLGQRPRSSSPADACRCGRSRAGGCRCSAPEVRDHAQIVRSRSPVASGI